ncbi:MAG TPA: ribosomal-processing cysteine protease Prp [Defluviitoga sp.]|nr:ribosomal-processing cysteine protease Prp [Defluviitoga sp.]HOP24745.1 ribosomal-processing cysteine protease Prp [Defluviitoga sp.]HPZ28314.1 ribosomal-processing cysteine protease Prp [Defluviitoga sp.]HQD62204.1 ribosomal-processing cysteine protease Prp [Defluviitoga sp.]
MIEVTYHGRDLPRMEIKGHSSYASAGTDIVCSAVSVLTQFVAEILKNEGLGEYEKNAGYLLIKASKKCEVSDMLFHYLLESLISISKDYPKNLKVEVR